MESIVEWSQFEQVTSPDLAAMGTLARQSMDHLVATVIEGGVAYAGLNCVGAAATAGVVTKVNVGDGYFFGAGGIYPLVGAPPQNLINKLPTVDQIIITIAAGGATDPNDAVEGRVFVRDVEGTRQRYQQDVPTRSTRVAQLTLVDGVRAAQPVAPAVDSTRVAVADVLLSPSGVVSVTMRTENQVGNLRLVLNALKAAQLEVDAIDRATQTIASDVSGLARSVTGKLSIDEGNRLKQALADVYSKIGLPQVYVDFGTDNCLDASQSATVSDVATYAARIEEGIRFPWAATRQATIQLLSPAAASQSIMVNNGLTMPAYDELWQRVNQGSTGYLVLNAFAYDSGTNLVEYTPARQRTRYGEPFEVSTSSLFWGTGTYEGFFSAYGKSTFLRDGETYQVEDTGEVDAYGAPIKRLREAWVDAGTSPYWSALSTPATANGYRWCQTALNAQSRIVTAIGVQIGHYATTDGPMQIGICKTTASDAPDDTKVLANVSRSLADLLASKPIQGGNRVPIKPTLLEKGVLYGYTVATSVDYWVVAGNVETVQNGQLFYRPTTIGWEQEPTHDILIDSWTASFRTARTVVDLQPLSLDGGFTAVDVLTTAVVPDAATLSFEIQDQSGAYKPISDPNGPDLGPMPGQAPWRMVFSGTTNLQAMIDLANSTVVTMRPAPALNHVSDLKVLAAPANRITITSKLESFDPAHHTVTPKIMKADGTLVAASLVNVVPDPNVDGTTVVTSVFNLSASITQFRRVHAGTTDTIHALYHIAKVQHVANQV